jgi:hypothetical protein
MTLSCHVFENLLFFIKNIFLLVGGSDDLLFIYPYTVKNKFAF